MNAVAYKKPGRVLIVWGVFCLAFVVLLAVHDVALARYTTHLRENDYRTHLGLAMECVERKDYLDALRHAERAKRLAPENPEPPACAGSIHYRMKNWARAIDNFNQAIKNGDASRGPRMDIVWSLIELERYDEAATLGAKYADEVVDNAPLLQHTAEAHLRAKRPEKALPLLQQALKTSPENVQQLNRIARIHRELGDDDAAADIEARIDAIDDAIGQLGNSEP